jgi:hypothetical protein
MKTKNGQRNYDKVFLPNLSHQRHCTVPLLSKNTNDFFYAWNVTLKSTPFHQPPHLTRVENRPSHTPLRFTFLSVTVNVKISVRGVQWPCFIKIRLHTV